MITESIMIVVDNCHFVPKDSPMHKLQVEAIRLYCRAKFKSNSKTLVGLATLGWGADRWPPRPDNDIEWLLTHGLENIYWGGEYNILQGVQYCQLAFAHISPLDTEIKRRMLVFVGGPCHGYVNDHLLKIGESMRSDNIALDVVSFAHPDPKFDKLKTKCLRSFVAAANNNKLNNSHFARFPLHSSVLEVLVSSKILSLSQAEGIPYTEEEIKKMKLSMKKKMKKKNLRRNRRKKNNCPQEDRPKEEPPVSSSSFSPPAVILPAYCQVPQKYKNNNRLVFGSWEMHQLVDVLSPSY